MTTRAEMGYWRNLLTAASHLLASVIGKRHDVSMSAQVGAWAQSPRLWSQMRAHALRPLIDGYFLRKYGEENHCVQAWLRWQRREKLLRANGL